MNEEQAKVLLKKIQNGTASPEERKLLQLAFSVLSKNILKLPGQ